MTPKQFQSKVKSLQNRTEKLLGSILDGAMPKSFGNNEATRVSDLLDSALHQLESLSDDLIYLIKINDSAQRKHQSPEKCK